MLELENVYKSFKHNRNIINVLEGIDLVIKPKQSLAITGASGVGKSTLLNIMGTLEPPTEGIVRFDNKNVNKMNEKDLCHLRNHDIGFVFQFHHLLPELNALENTTMPALIARSNRKKSREKASEILSRVGLEKRLYHRVGELSGGEQQRVAIARALIMRPKLLLADEPTGNLDFTTGQGIIDLLLQLNETEELAMVIATHNLQLAKRMTQQLEIVNGRVRWGKQD